MLVLLAAARFVTVVELTRLHTFLVVSFSGVDKCSTVIEAVWLQTIIVRAFVVNVT